MDSQTSSSDSLNRQMRRRSVLGMGLLSLTGLPSFAVADEKFGNELSSDTLLAYARFERGMKDLEGFLTANRLQVPAFSGLNYFGVSVGGIDAVRDLEESRGVDPETFAALHAGFALPEVGRHLNLKKEIVFGGNVKLRIDAADGRLRYKDSAVRMYSPDRLKELFDRRASFQVDDERKRVTAFAEFVATRQQTIVQSKSGSTSGEAIELSDRYRAMKPIISELESAIDLDASTSSIMQGGSFNVFAMSIGGINVEDDLSKHSSVDPETFAAMLADKVSPEFTDRIKWTGGRLFFDDKEVKLYPMTLLEQCFKHRERLSQMSLRP